MDNRSNLEQRLALLRRLAMLCAVLVLTITSISAFIRVSNAGLGCTDWPQCYGARLRQAQQGIEPAAADSAAIVVVRVLHRISAVAALAIIIMMLIACFSAKPVLWQEGRITLALLVLALFLAVLGRWTSGARLPAVAIGNLFGGFAMLALSWRLHQAAGAIPNARAAPRTWARIGLAVLIGQIALGGLVSAAYAGLSCTGFPDCGTTLWPAQVSLEAFNPWREPVFVAGSPANPPGAAPHMAHRYGALGVLLLLVPLAISAFASGRRRVAAALVALLAIEAILGVLMVATGLPLWAALAHNLGAALLLALVFAMV